MKKKTSNKKASKKASKKGPVVVELPNDYAEMESFVENNRVLINEMLVESFDYAVKKKFSGIEVFSFVGSDYVVVVNQQDFRDNLQNIFDYSLENELFETCGKVKKVMELMDRLSFTMKCKKDKPK